MCLVKLSTTAVEAVQVEVIVIVITAVIAAKAAWFLAAAATAEDGWKSGPYKAS